MSIKICSNNNYIIFFFSFKNKKKIDFLNYLKPVSQKHLNEFVIFPAQWKIFNSHFCAKVA